MLNDVEENKLIPSFAITIINTSKNVISDYAEIALDSILDEGIIKEIPFVKTINSICKIGFNIRERHLLKETFKFIKGFNDGTLSAENINKYRDRIKNDKKVLYEELERVLVLLDRHIFDNQSLRLGKIYKHYVLGSINWEKFIELMNINEKLTEYNINILYKFFNENQISKKDFYQVKILEGLGLVFQQKNTYGSIGKPYEFFSKDNYAYTTIAETFYQCINK